MRPVFRSAIVALAAVATGALSLPAKAQDIRPPLSLAALTVPAERLPDGCGLKVIEPGRSEVIASPERGRQAVRFSGPTPSMQPPGVTANPWIGADRHVLAWLRQRTDGPRKMSVPDGGPLTAHEQAAFTLQYADGVEEGYAATYAQSQAPDIAVQAVRFAVPPGRPLDLGMADHPNQRTARFEIGTIRVVLTSDGGPCANAIEAYLKSLQR